MPMSYRNPNTGELIKGDTVAAMVAYGALCPDASVEDFNKDYVGVYGRYGEAWLAKIKVAAKEPGVALRHIETPCGLIAVFRQRS